MSPPPSSVCTNSARFRFVGRYLVISGLLLLPCLAIAQVGGNASDAGSTLWSAFRSVLYGSWGLVGSAAVVGMGIYMFLERGFMHALGVMVAGAMIFFVPLIVISMRNTAQALGGGG
jgi:ABC-type maltose transport system permease subunit